MISRTMARLVLLLIVAMAPAHAIRADDFEYEHEPIAYTKTAAANEVSRLADRLQSGETKLEHQPRLGYLRSLLKELKIPESSQMLVFSKTSLQRHRITPRTPRALYYNDDTYVGYCLDGDVLEISTADTRLGAVFYALPQDQTEPAQLVRQGDNCLICHASNNTRNVPGHVVRSVFVDPQGLPVLASGTYRIDQTSPLEHRWGGWYVSGTHGSQKHLGNLIVRERGPTDLVDNSAGMNLTDLGERFEKSGYLTPHSDLVALMVLEHQTDAHNFLTRANFQTRSALHYQETLNRQLGEPEREWDSVKSRIKNAGEALVEYLLFCEEAKLTHRIAGVTDFAREFSQRGPRDRRGRSLRDFDLETRMFKHPCSYLIYSPSFQELPSDARDYVLRRLWEVLTSEDDSPKFAHLSPADRTAIREILLDTLPNLPDYWRESAVGSTGGK